MRKILLAVVLFISFSVTVFGQARLNISSGGSVYFYFNSYQKYVTGITYNDFTKLIVQYNDTTSSGSYGNWRIDVKSLSSGINGDAGNTLSLSVIELSATGTVGTSTGIRTLKTTDETLLNSTNNTGAGTETVSVTYYCGKTVSLLGEKQDYYVVDILFTLMGY